ncbi:hypothetical protein J6S46_00375 [Candidatus Saccharibacteria bacterium]|nr:hypothetical protein [Candidatus Saccharibacteria bacterium]
MADNAKKSKKKIIAGIIAGILIIASIVVAVILINRPKVIDDNFFKDDGTKYVLSQEGGINGANKTHTVLYYNDKDEITKWEVYGEYDDEDTAKAAFDYIKSDDPENSDYELTGKYIVHHISEEYYGNGESASSYKQWFDALRTSEEETNESAAE